MLTTPPRSRYDPSALLPSPVSAPPTSALVLLMVSAAPCVADRNCRPSPSRRTPPLMLPPSWHIPGSSARAARYGAELWSCLAPHGRCSPSLLVQLAPPPVPRRRSAPLPRPLALLGDASQSAHSAAPAAAALPLEAAPDLDMAAPLHRPPPGLLDSAEARRWQTAEADLAHHGPRASSPDSLIGQLPLPHACRWPGRSAGVKASRSPASTRRCRCSPSLDTPLFALVPHIAPQLVQLHPADVEILDQDLLHRLGMFTGPLHPTEDRLHLSFLSFSHRLRWSPLGDSGQDLQDINPVSMELIEGRPLSGSEGLPTSLAEVALPTAVGVPVLDQIALPGLPMIGAGLIGTRPFLLLQEFLNPLSGSFPIASHSRSPRSLYINSIRGDYLNPN